MLEKFYKNLIIVFIKIIILQNLYIFNIKSFTFVKAFVKDDISIIIVTSHEGLSNNLRRISSVLTRINFQSWGITPIYSPEHNTPEDTICLCDYFDCSLSHGRCLTYNETKNIQSHTCKFAAREKGEIRPWMLLKSSWNFVEYDVSKKFLPKKMYPNGRINKMNTTCILPVHLGGIHHGLKVKQGVIDFSIILKKHIFFENVYINKSYFSIHWRRGDQLTHPQRCIADFNPLVCSSNVTSFLQKLRKIHSVWYVGTNEMNNTIRTLLEEGLPGLTVRLLPDTYFTNSFINFNQSNHFEKFYKNENYNMSKTTMFQNEAFIIDLVLMALSDKFYAIRKPMSSVHMLVEHVRKQLYHDKHNKVKSFWL